MRTSFHRITRGSRWARFTQSTEYQSGGEGGIRTLGRVLAYVRFRVECLQPLSHLSLKRGRQSNNRRLLVKPSIRKNDRAVTVDDRAVMHVVTDAFREGDPLAVAAEADEVRGRVEMLHALDLLLDD